MRKSEYFSDIRDIVSRSIEECRDIDNKITLNEKRKRECQNSGRYTKKHVDDLTNETRELKRMLTARLDACDQNVKELTAAYCEEIRALDAMRGEDITPDADLLKYKLKKSDYMEMLKRNEGNRTMTRLILDSAKTAGVDLGVHYNPASDEAKAIETTVPYTASIAAKWYNKPAVYDELMGDGSDLASQFAEDD